PRHRPELLARLLPHLDPLRSALFADTEAREELIESLGVGPRPGRRGAAGAPPRPRRAPPPARRRSGSPPPPRGSSSSGPESRPARARPRRRAVSSIRSRPAGPSGWLSTLVFRQAESLIAFVDFQ